MGSFWWVLTSVFQNKHCVLDVTCAAVDRLNYAQMYPVVIFLKTESKDILKDIRAATESKRKSTKKLIIEAQKLEKSSAYLFTGNIFFDWPIHRNSLVSLWEFLWFSGFAGVVPIKNKSTWFKSIYEMIEQQQQSAIWMSEKQARFVIYCTVSWFYWLLDRLIDWLTVFHHSIQFIDCKIDWLIVWLIDGLMSDGWLIDWLIDWWFNQA